MSPFEWTQEPTRHAIALAVEAGTLAFAPTMPKSLTENNARQGFFERADFLRVVTALPNDDGRDFMTWFYWTGMRPGEVRSLTWAALDRERGRSGCMRGMRRRGDARAFPLGGELRPIIERRLKARRFDCEYIFHRRHSRSSL